MYRMTKVLSIFGFLQFGWADILDIGMVALLIFFLLRSIRGNSTVMNIVLVLALLVAAQAIASTLNMRMMTVLLNAILDVGVLAIIIIFQPEIRHLLNRFAMQTGISRRTGDLFNRVLGIKEEQLGSRSVEELAEAVRAMSAEKTGAVVTAEEHNIIGGLGSAVAEALSENCPVPFERVGVRDTFGRSGKVPQLLELYGLTAAEIVAKAKAAVARKK